MSRQRETGEFSLPETRPPLGDLFGRREIVYWLDLLASMTVDLNYIRNLAAHHYRNDGGRMTRLEQFEDSVNICGGPFADLFFRSICAITRCATCFRHCRITTAPSPIDA